MIKRFTDGEDSGSLTLPPAPENYNAEEPPPATGPGPDSGQAESEPPAGQPAKDDNSATTVSAAEAIVESAEPASPATATGNTSSSAIILDFSAACWVDIRDSAGDQVLVGEFQPGEQRRLQGIPPFSVLIGNAPAVRVSVDGQPFDLAPHTRGRVARMTLDPTQN